ncbi:MAG: LysR substrate-binding domain-containing protein [Armatimonadota bacterium]|nr:LysR substrate-binding domain-containing protein [Armatimonadota bacterium]MDR7534581.1 LysR substrate-binding domain-containing protein [Armatimonadota bacterium]MDR7535033.1 LysR substrate-binding domain-containing protein [Armatimonadota bacterium]
MAMARAPLPLGPLRTFHQVVVHQAFNRAARALGVTQPAVTQQMRRLERATGVTLFERDGRRLVLTEAGRALAVYTQRIFDLVDAAQDALAGARELRTGILRVGASRTAGAYYIADLLDRFKQRYPGVKVSLTVGNSQLVLDRIREFSLHAGLVAGRPDDAALVTRPLVRDRMLVVLPPRHPLAQQARVSIRDLQGWPLIMREPGSTTRHLIEQAAAARGVLVDAAMELESNEAIKSAVADGIGVAIMAHAAVAQDLASGRLVGRPLREALALDFALVYHRDRVLAPVLAAFLALLPARARRGAGAPGGKHTPGQEPRGRR